MARNVTVEVNHSVYDTFDHQRGAELTVSRGALKRLLRSADAALDHQDGGFIEVIDAKLIVGFENGGRTEGTKGGMRYFDIFTMPVEAVGDIYLFALVNELRTHKVNAYRERPQPTKTILVSARRSSNEPEMESQRSRLPESSHDNWKMEAVEEWEDVTTGSNSEQEKVSDPGSEQGAKEPKTEQKGTGSDANTVPGQSENHSQKDPARGSDDEKKGIESGGDQKSESGYEKKWDEEGNRIENTDADTKSGESDYSDGNLKEGDEGKPTDSAEELAARRETNHATTTGHSDNSKRPMPSLTGSEVTPGFVAQMWEQLRRDSTQCRALIREVDEFRQVVDGAIQEISFVSKDRVETDYFDVVGTGNLENRFETEQLERIIGHLAEYDELEYQTLPTYRDELKSMQRRHKAEVRDKEYLKREVSDSTQSFHKRVVEEFGTVNDHAAAVMEEAESGTLIRKSDEKGFTSKLTGLVRGEEDELAFLTPTEYAELDAETVAAIDAEIRDQQENVREAIENQLLPTLKKDLLNELNQQSRRSAEQAAHRLNATYRSEKYERADIEDSK